MKKLLSVLLITVMLTQVVTCAFAAKDNNIDYKQDTSDVIEKRSPVEDESITPAEPYKKEMYDKDGLSPETPMIIHNDTSSDGNRDYQNNSIRIYERLGFTESSLKLSSSVIEQQTHTEETVDKEASVSDFTYTVADGTVTITGYRGTDSDPIVPEFIEGCPVTTIGSGAFQLKRTINTVILPNSLIEIGDHAFEGCFGLNTIIIPEKVMTIGEDAFYYCESLIEISIPASVITIGENAFMSCHSLMRIAINEGIKSIGKGAFQNCERLTDISLPYGIKTVEDGLFANCYALTRVILPESVSSIGESAFWGCSALSQINLPENVNRIGSFAFTGCSCLKEVIIPNGVSVIEENTFQDCSGLTRVTIPQSVVTIGGLAFSGCSSLENVLIPDGVETIDGMAFKQCSNIKEVIIPQTVTRLAGAFSGCYGLSLIQYNASSVSFADDYQDTFADVGRDSPVGLRVVFGETVKDIPPRLFYKCTGITELVFSDSIDTIGDAAFLECTNLNEVKIPEIVTIGDYVFGGCTSLQRVTISDGIAAISAGTFSGCTALYDVAIPSSVISIGEEAFSGCVSIEEVILPDSIIEIEYGAFNGCTGLKKIEIPENVTAVGEIAFFWCTNLETVIWNPVNAICGKQAFDLAGSENNNGFSVIFGNTVEAVPRSIFEGCEHLKEVTLTDSVKTIGQNAFLYCSGLTDVYYNKSACEWRGINTEEGNTQLLYAMIHFAVGPSFKSQSLVLSGQIGINFFLELPEVDGVDYSKSYMVFTIGEDSTEYWVEFDPNHMNNAHTRYGFTCYVNSIQMADRITATFYYGDGEYIYRVAKDYSVAQYIDFFEKNIGLFNTKTITLIRAIADFGHYEQIYLADVNHWTIGDKYAEMATHYTDTFNYASILSAVNDKAFVKSLGSSNVEKATYKLHLDSETTVDVFLTPKSGKTLTATATFNGKTYKAVKQSDGRYLVQIPNISAHQMGEMITVTGTAGTTFTVKVSALSYTRSVLNNASSNTAAKDGLSALYQYYAAVLAYRK